MNEEILLTVTMLVSDREDTIEKCMKSLKHLLDTLPSELIVVDTAGNQFCMDIVRQYTDKIVRFEWCDDFAAARNAGLSKARGQWFMFLDDDEWFESTEKIENFFLSGEYRSYNSAGYIVRNYHNMEGTSWSNLDVMRIVKRERNTRFEGRIHERAVPLYSPTCYLDDFAHHYGYAFRSDRERNEHSWRNIRLLLEMRKKNPTDCHTLAQLIQEYMAVKEYFSAIELCREVTRQAGNWSIEINSIYATYALGTEMNIYNMQKRFGDGYQAGKELLQQKSLTLLAKCVLYNQMAGFCYEIGKYEEVSGYIESFKEVYKDWEDFPDKRRQDAFGVCGKYVEPGELHRFELLQLHIHVLQGDWPEAEKALLAVSWEDESQKIMEETPKDVISVLKNTAFNEAYLKVLGSLQTQLIAWIAVHGAVEHSSEEEKEILPEYFRLLPPDDPKLCEYHLIYAGNHNDLSVALPALEKMQEANFPFFLKSEAYWDSLRKLDVDINAYMTALSTYDWMEMAGRLWAALPVKTCEKAYRCLMRGLEKTDIRYIYISALLMEKKLLARERELLDGAGSDVIWSELSQLSQYWVSCAASLYREDVFMGDLIRAIPPAYQFGWYIMQANALKSTNPGLFLTKVADAAKAYPVMKELCKKVIIESKENL